MGIYTNALYLKTDTYIYETFDEPNDDIISIYRKDLQPMQADDLSNDSCLYSTKEGNHSGYIYGECLWYAKTIKGKDIKTDWDNIKYKRGDYLILPKLNGEEAIDDEADYYVIYSRG